MKQSLAFLAIFLFCTTGIFAQEVEPTATKTSSIEKASRDFVMLQFTYENWNNTPDSIKVSGLGRGMNAYLCYDFPIAKSNFSFAAGIGISTANVYFDNQQVIFTDTGAAGAQVRFVPEQQDYKKFKLTTAYLEAPFELRYFGNKENRNKGFKAAIGLRVGTLVGAHTKGRRSVDGTKVIDKVNTKRHMENWRFAGTVRIGWGNFTLMGSYSLSTMFKEGAGPGVTPYSVGLCISGL